MHRRLVPRRHRAALITLGLVAAASAGTLRSLSATEAHPPEQSSSRARAKAKKAAPVTSVSRQGPDGKQIFATTCAACHQASGQGVEGTFPPLAGSEWVQGDENKLVRIVLQGLTGPVEVAGETYTSAMPAWGGVLKDPEMAALLTYVRSGWGNKAAPVTAARVASIRSATASRKTPWTVAELAKVPSDK